VASAQKILAGENQRLEESQGRLRGRRRARSLDGPAGGAQRGSPGKPAQDFGDNLFQIATDTYALEGPSEPQPPSSSASGPDRPALVLIPDLQIPGITGDVKEIKGAQCWWNSTAPSPPSPRHVATCA